MYWLTFSLIWGTKRLFETRQMGPEEENEWTFGQTLPLVLLIAPLATIIEHFFHSSESREREDRTPSHTVTVSSSRLDVEDVQDDGMVGIDHDYVDSISYQGVVCLAALAYIEAGLFFVLDNMYRGIRRPLPSFAFLFFILNPTLQMLWIACALWISRMNWIIPLQRSSRAIILIALAVTSMTGFLSGSDDFFNVSTLGNYLIAYASIVATFAINACVGDSQWMSLRLLPALLQLPILYLATQVGGIPAFWPCLLAFLISLFWVAIEWHMEDIRLDSMKARYIRFAVSLFVFIPTLILNNVFIGLDFDDSDISRLTIFSCCSLVFVGLIISLLQQYLRGAYSFMVLD